MPYKSEKIPIAGTKHDRRRKLSKEQADAIKILKEQGYSYRQLAAMFNVSKWTVQNLIHPTKRSTPRKRPTAYWTEKKRQCRQRKQALYKSGQINAKTRRKSNRRY